MTEKVQNTQTSILSLKVFLASPIIILPFKHDGNLKNEVWVLNLGNLSICSNEELIKSQEKEKTAANNKDMFDISLRNIKMQYYNSIADYENLIQD